MPRPFPDPPAYGARGGPPPAGNTPRAATATEADPIRSLAVPFAFALLLVPFAGAALGPDPDTHYFTRINVTHERPWELVVVIVPPAFSSASAYTADDSWIGADALLSAPGTRAALEATSYWAWYIDQHEDEYPTLKRLVFTVKVLGVDATPFDLQMADITIHTAYVADPVPFVAFAGIGLPTHPAEAFFFNDGPQRLCTVVNTGAGGDAFPRTPVVWVPGAAHEQPTTLRNLILHEFGHCLGAGHVGESLGLAHCNGAGQCYENHPDDIMSVALQDRRQCLSNANLVSLAEGYFWNTGPGARWQQHDAEAYILKSQYEQECIPAALERF